MSKYHSIREKCRLNHSHDSKKEANRCNELWLMERGNLIKDLRYQVPFELQGRFKFRGKSYLSITYLADFVYFDIQKGYYVIEDTKGYRTEVYKLKKKLLLYTLRERDDIRFVET